MFMPKIENWDNELANNIPPLMSQVIDTSKLKDNLDLSNSKSLTLLSDQFLNWSVPDDLLFLTDQSYR